jgi:hypothetical protein
MASAGEFDEKVGQQRRQCKGTERGAQDITSRNERGMVTKRVGVQNAERKVLFLDHFSNILLDRVGSIQHARRGWGLEISLGSWAKPPRSRRPGERGKWSCRPPCLPIGTPSLLPLPEGALTKHQATAGPVKSAAPRITPLDHHGAGSRRARVWKAKTAQAAFPCFTLTTPCWRVAFEPGRLANGWRRVHTLGYKCLSWGRGALKEKM